jgi:transcriptional regulator with XRE-family HTH domain
MSDAESSPVEIADVLFHVREKLRCAATESGLSQHEIGVRMGYSATSARQAVSRMLNADDYDPRLSTLLAFARAIQKPLKDLL